MSLFWLLVCGFTLSILPGILNEQKEGAIIVVDNDDTQESSVDVDESAETAEVFLPTHDWQTVKPGQGIPRGLHVRMNLATGLKEAKLMDSDGSPQPETDKMQTFSKQTVKELKEALRLLKDDGTVGMDIENGDNVPKKFRSIEEIKEEFANLNMKMVTEEEIMKDLLKMFIEPDSSAKQKADIFLELEYYVHKYDNAVEFAKMGGIQKAILALNSSDEDLRYASAFLLGSAVQSHPQIKVLAMDNGAMQSLVRHLATEASRSVQIKCLFAISCMIRQFPYAQKNFLELGGLSVLAEFFGKTEADTEKLQIKSIALLYDMIMEHQSSSSHASSEGVTTDGKLLQYDQVNIKEAVKQFEFCPYIPRLLSAQDHDTKEKVVLLMSVLVDICWESFSEWDNQIELLQKQYHDLALAENEPNEEQNDKSYFSEIVRVIDDLRKNLQEHATRHSEL